MTNFILEGDIDFSKELLNLICNEEEKNEKVCLISGNELTENFVTLDCNHSFNYNNIFKEIRMQRKKNRLEVQNLKLNQIKCPYCRSLHNGILPWIEGVPKIINVNCTKKTAHKNCIAILKSGKRKGEKCGCKVKIGDYCGRHKQ